MSHIEEFWLGVHSLSTILEAGDGDGLSPEVLDALRGQYTLLSPTTQEELQRELVVTIAGLQRLQDAISGSPGAAAPHDGDGSAMPSLPR